MKPCDYCKMGWKPLFRIVETYVREYDCTDGCSPKECLTTECESYKLQYNRLNITVAIVGNALIFEDKYTAGNADTCKPVIDIKYCPMCGREL